MDCEGLCDQVIPAGAGDDTKNRFAIESYSRYLTATGHEKERITWEKICIDHAKSAGDNGVKDFFMKQLQLVGGDASVEAMKEFLSSKEVCEPALAVILASGSKNAETVLAGSLANRDLPCAAAVMNALASMKSDNAINEYIHWTTVIDVNTRASAFHAIAMSGSPAALKVLSEAAKKVEYHWELTGAVAALLDFSDLAAQKGDIETMDKITKTVISKIKDGASVQNKSAALGIYTKYHGFEAMPLLYKAAAHSNFKYRAAAMRYSLDIEGTNVVNGWINYYKRAINAAKPQLIAMFGERGDKLALPLINDALADKKDGAIRAEAARAIAAISKNEAISALVNYMIIFRGDNDQKAAKEALMTVMRNEDIRFILPVLKEESVPAVRTSLELLSWKRDPKYFNDVFALTSSSNDTIKAAAIKALPELAGPEHQQQLIDLLGKTENAQQVADLQNAIAMSANQNEDPEKRSELVIRAINTDNSATLRTKLVPVLAKTGGREALSVVLKEFENGNPEMRDISFKSLTGWRDYSASSALYEILASGNKTFGEPAFQGYIRQIRTAALPDEQKYLLLRKIAPFAGSALRKNALLSEMGRVNTYQCLFFVATYLDDTEASATAAKAAMTIALPNVNAPAGMYGTMVRDILTKVTGKLAGSESEYDREQVNKYLAEMPADEGFKSMFNGKDLTGWKGLVEDPVKRSKMKPAELAKKQAEADTKVPAKLEREGWMYLV